MHFCVSATRGGFHCGFCWPRKIGTNWFMPALVKSRFGLSGISEDDGTMVCCFSRKKSRNDWRICALVIGGWVLITGYWLYLPAARVGNPLQISPRAGVRAHGD